MACRWDLLLHLERDLVGTRSRWWHLFHLVTPSNALSCELHQPPSPRTRVALLLVWPPFQVPFELVPILSLQSWLFLPQVHHFFDGEEHLQLLANNAIRWRQNPRTRLHPMGNGLERCLGKIFARKKNEHLLQSFRPPLLTIFLRIAQTPICDYHS